MNAKEDNSIQVIVRVRGLNEREKNEGAVSCITPSFISNKTLKLESKPSPKEFTFDHICTPEFTQAQIFNLVGKNLVDSGLQGYNACIFAYGQTGAGKTYTMQGNGINDINSQFFQEQRGLQPRVFEYLFNQIGKNKDVEYLIQANYYEIYNEQIYDLLSDDITQKCQIRESINKGIYIENITDSIIQNSIQTVNVLKRGQNARHTGPTLMNAESSRSHSVFSIVLETKKTINGVVNVKQSKIHFVDLAGSERQNKTQAQGERLKEATNINKSLTVLGLVINSLVEQNNGRNRHIPYRNSKLTHILKDSLGGNSKTYMIAAISEADTQFQETLSTLKFAQRAKLIKNNAYVNEETSGNINDLKQEIKRLKSEITKIQTNQPQQNTEEYHTQILSGFVNNWNLKIQEIEQFIKDQLKDIHKIYQYSFSQEDNIQYNQLEISNLKLNELTNLKSEIENKLKKSNILNNTFQQNDEKIGEANPHTPKQQVRQCDNTSQLQQYAQIQKHKQDFIDKSGFCTPIKSQTKNTQDMSKSPINSQQTSSKKHTIMPQNQQYSASKEENILHQFFQKIGKISTEKKDQKQIQINDQKCQQQNLNQYELEITQLKQQITQLTQINEQAMIREQKQIQDFQAQKMVSNQIFEKKIQKLIQENEQLSIKNQQLMEKNEEDHQAYVSLLQEKQQIVQDLEISEEMKIHWENMYQNEHKRYRFNYELVQDQLDEIQKLKEQIENNEKIEKQIIQSKPYQNSQNSKLFQRKPLVSSINRSLNSSTISEKNNQITGGSFISNKSSSQISQKTIKNNSIIRQNIQNIQKKKSTEQENKQYGYTFQNGEKIIKKIKPN